MTKPRVLFLDDMEWRHAEFQLQAERLGVEVHHVWSAEKALEAFESQTYDQVFLDHDLSESDIMVEVGSHSLVPTGMVVVDHLVKNVIQIPRGIVIHSCNGPAALEMEKRLLGAGYEAARCPFPFLINGLSNARNL